MSRSFEWRPVVPEPPPSGEICLNLWHLLCDYKGTQEGWTDSLTLDVSDLGFLRGVAVASRNSETSADAAALATAIQRHHAIEITVLH